jgi:probable rRNA maturation factor
LLYLKREKKSLVSLFFIFCKDEYLLNINKQFLQHDDYTDIITFNLSDNINTIEGEIYISIDRIKENATLNRVSQKEELHRVMFHGVLHLCGYKDKTPKDKKKMTTAENKCLELYFS